MIYAGRVVHPTNADYNDPGGIHDDVTAQNLGFRGGTIAGSAHLDTFVPVLLDVFGDEWFRTGSLSVYFKHATTDGEPTQAFVEDGGMQARAWMHGTDNVLVGEGTAGIGEHDTELRTRDLRHDPGRSRILANVWLGQQLRERTMQIDAAKIANGCRTRITEPIDAYTSSNPIAPPSALIDLFSDMAASALSQSLPEAVGMWGALEVRHHRGPFLLDHPYEVSGTVVAISDTPKTEVLWYDAQAHDRAGTLVASGRIMTRFVKASSTLYNGN